MNQIIHGDCLQVMKNIECDSIDFICCDLPYGVTAPKWDINIDMKVLWPQYNRLIKPDGVIALFASQPFTTKLITSNEKNFKYCWYWCKNQTTNFFHAKRMPLRKIEEICIFNGKKYFPQITDGHIPTSAAVGCTNGNAYHGKTIRNYEGGNTTRYPHNLLEFKCVDNYSRLHSSEKPVELLEYLVKTYTNENDMVLDNCAGSGSTGVACKNLNRNFILIEKEKSYYDICVERLK